MSFLVRPPELRIDLLDEARPNNPIVTILIAGKDILGGLGGGFIGFDPADLLDSGALLPSDPPRRVCVYRCNCGEAGCGCVAPLIDRRGDSVVWSDFRAFTGVYVKPLVDVSPSGGSSHGLPDLRFTATQYLDEVARAMSDRSWETDARQAARRLRELLAAKDGPLVELGYWPGWVAPHWEAPGVYEVDFVGPRGQVVVALAPETATAADQADEMLQTLLTLAPEEWNVSHRNDWSPDAVERAIAARAEVRRSEAATGTTT